jgi:chloramphenicol O-acetyltransferase type A
MSVRIIEFTNPHRRKHFFFFRDMAVPHFHIVAPVDVAALVQFVEAHALYLTGTIVYLLVKAANAVPELRWRIRGDQVVEHDLVHPSFTVPTEEADVFSFCYVDYDPDYHRFVDAVKKAKAQIAADPSLENADDRDDFLFMSAMPWVHFTGFSHPTHVPARDSVPRIVWGKIKSEGRAHLMPVGVQAHHAVVDGRHAAHFFEIFTQYCANPEQEIPL